MTPDDTLSLGRVEFRHCGDGDIEIHIDNSTDGLEDEFAWLDKCQAIYLRDWLIGRLNKPLGPQRARQTPNSMLPEQETGGAP